MTSLFNLISGDEVSLDLLEEAAAEEDILIDCLTDEELYWLRGNDANPDPNMDEPYLSGLGGEARSVAIDSGLRSLIAKGMVDLDPENPEAMQVVGPYALVGTLRGSAEAITRVRLDVVDHPPVRYAFSRVTPALVLTEEVADDGFHDFTLQSPDSAATSLCAVFDRLRTAGDVSERSQRVSDRSSLSPSIDELGAQARFTVLVVSAGVDFGGEPFERLLTVYGCDDGVWVYWGVNGEDGEEYVLGRYGVADLAGLAADLVVGRAG